MSKPVADSGLVGFAAPPPNRAKDSRSINGHLKDLADPMGAARNRVTLPRHRAVRFPDSRRVRRSDIYLHCIVGVTPTQLCQRACDERKSLLIIGKVNLI